MSSEFDILKLVCCRLEQANIPYMLTGSLASNFYAIPRMTRDIDLVVEIHSSKIDALVQIFKDDFYIDKNSIIEAIKHESVFNIIHNVLIYKIDFIIRKNILYRTIEFQRRRQVQLNNARVWIVSPEDLIISKLFWAKDSFSEMQLKDIKNLLLVLKNLDKDYINEWVQTLGLKNIYSKVQD
jgi:hypothetical protein